MLNRERWMWPSPLLRFLKLTNLVLSRLDSVRSCLCLKTGNYWMIHILIWDWLLLMKRHKPWWASNGLLSLSQVTGCSSNLILSIRNKFQLTLTAKMFWALKFRTQTSLFPVNPEFRLQIKLWQRLKFPYRNAWKTKPRYNSLKQRPQKQVREWVPSWEQTLL